MGEPKQVLVFSKLPRLDFYDDLSGYSQAMCESERLTIPGKAQPKQRPRFGYGGRVYTPQATAAFEASIKKRALANRIKGKMIQRPLGVSLTYWQPDRRRADLDNLAKSQLDALNRVCFQDDSYVDVLLVVRAFDPTNPRSELRLWSLRDTAFDGLCPYSL